MRKIIGTIAGAAGMFLLLPAAAFAASLSLQASLPTVQVGDEFEVAISLDTQGSAIEGVDIYTLNFDPSVLEVVDSDPAAAGTQISPSGLLPLITLNSADNSAGKISFSALAAGGSSFSSQGTIATVRFKAKAAGSSALNFVFTLGSTTDTNVAGQGQDVLTSVGTANFTVNAPASSGGGGGSSGGGGGGGGSYSGGGSNPPLYNPPVSNQGSGSSVGPRLVNSNGTFYFISGGVRRGITNPGLLASHGFSLNDAKTASAGDLSISEGSLLLPGDGALVKSQEDPTVYLVSRGQRFGFVSSSVFTALGFKFTSVLVVTNPELQQLPKADNLSNSQAAHQPGLDILRNGTVYWIGEDSLLHPYPTLAIYNSWHKDNDFSAVVPANDADFALGVGEFVGQRIIE